MAQSGDDRIAIPDAGSLCEVLARFQDPLPHVATWQIVTTILPLIALLVAMHAGLAFGWWPLLALGIPAAALTVRTFSIQHDCGHGSFCRRRRANDLLGRFCSLLTLTPYANGGATTRNTTEPGTTSTDATSTAATYTRPASRWPSTMPSAPGVSNATAPPSIP
jgi:Fatty acid desaturase